MLGILRIRFNDPLFQPIRGRNSQKMLEHACKTLGNVLKDHDLPRAVLLSEVGAISEMILVVINGLFILYKNNFYTRNLVLEEPIEFAYKTEIKNLALVGSSLLEDGF